MAPRAGQRTYTVGELARLAKVSVRTLHHYDAVGLLCPSGRTEAGYRLYGSADLRRLQQALFFKELGFALEEIRGIMTDPGFDRREALLVQRELLAEKAERAEAMLAAIDGALAAMEGATPMSDEEMFEVFGESDPEQYEAEAEERWGDTEAYKESARRTKHYTRADWERIKDEGEAQMVRMLELFDAGVSPEDPRAMDVADEARLHVDRWFYPCSREMHACLGEMYVEDARFTAHYDEHREGLARWFRDAIEANARRTA
ncbi:MAG: MerR family transcriptional regulator [Coriobacteriia bacterium]|nr:MerR family transcriptional regulator [Coriobacteriia bacterium]